MENEETNETLLHKLANLKQMEKLYSSQQDVLSLLEITSKIMTIQSQIPEYNDTVVEEIATLTQTYLSTVQRILTTLQVAESQARLLPNNNSYFGEYQLCSLRRTAALKFVHSLDRLIAIFTPRFEKHTPISDETA